MDLRKTLISNKIKNLITNETKILSFCLIVILILSMSTANADQIVINSDNQKQIRSSDIVSVKTVMHHPNNFQIALTENIGLAENSPPKNGQVKQDSTTNTYSLNLSEKITLNENHDTSFIVITTSHPYALQTTMDKISNNERVRFNGKSIVVDNIPPDKQTITLSQLENDFVLYTEKNIVQSLEKIFYTNLISNISPAHNEINTVSQIIQPIGNDVVWFVHAGTDPKNPIILLLLVPPSGYLLFRSRREEISIF